MAVQYLYTRQINDAELVNVSFNDVSLTVINQVIPYSPSVDYSFYGEGEILNIYCSGTTSIKITTLDNEPYALITETPNASACGYSTGDGTTTNPPDEQPIVINSLSASAETSLNGNNGSVLISVNEDNLFTSLDGINYTLRQNYYGGLPPGQYTIIVTDGVNRTTTQDFTIASYQPVYGCTNSSALNYNPSADFDNGSCVFYSPDPVNPAPPPDIPTSLPEDSRRNLYEDPDTFRIGINGAWTIIDMPKGWESIQFQIERDEVYHGLNYEYNDGEIELKFDAAAGMELLRAQYELNGNDAQVQFQFGRDINGLFLADVDGWIDFNTYQLDRDFVTTSVKRKTFNDDIETKSEVVVTIKDGYFNLPLHSKQIQQRTVVNMGYKTGSLFPQLQVNRNPAYGTHYQGGLPFFNAAIFTFIDFSNANPSDLTKNAPALGVQATSPLENKNYIFKAEGNGIYKFSFNLGIHLYTKAVEAPINFGGGPQQGAWFYVWYLVINRAGFIITRELGGGQTAATNSRFNERDYRMQGYYEENLLQDDEVYLYGRYIMEAKGSVSAIDAQININDANIVIDSVSSANPTTTPAILTYELGQKILSENTGGAAILKSNLLGRTDIGYPIDGCGALTSYTNGYLIRGFGFEERPIQITFKDWLEGVNTLNCIGMSYELGADGKYSVRIEGIDYFYADVQIVIFGSVQAYKEQIDTKRIYNKVDFGYLKYPTDDFSTLDEFNTRHEYLAPTTSFKNTKQQICPQIGSGDAIELTRRKQKKVSANDTFKYDEDNFVIASVRDGSLYKPERVENYTASGVVGADTLYNLRFTITRLIERWGKWLNSAWAYKKLSDKLTNTYVAKNGDLVSQYTGLSNCESKTVFDENGDIFVSDIQNGEKLFYPENITFQTNVDWQTLNLLRRCHTGSDYSGRNYGYISVINPEGDVVSGYLKTLTYNPLTELTTFVLYKKYLPLGEPFDCTEYSDYTFADFEAATGIPAEIEQCKFEVFA